MKELFLLKLGEIVLKGQNRRVFEDKLKTVTRRRMAKFGTFKVSIVQSTLYVEPLTDDCDLDGAWEACGTIFGVAQMCRCRACEKDLDAIFAAVCDYLGDELSMARSFKVESKRSDKRFPLNSIQISQEIGGRLAEEFPNVAVDVHTPDYTVNIEVRETAAYVHGPSVPGAGGLPTGTGGRAAVLLSGGIDSPVAGYMIAKRGVEIECIHFFSYPYTSELAKEKVLELAHIMTKFCGRMTVDIVGFTEIQEAIRDHCREEYFTIIMRRFMMRIAEAIGRDHGAKCLVTGENLGQVASQTMDAMAVTDPVDNMDVIFLRLEEFVVCRVIKNPRPSVIGSRIALTQRNRHFLEPEPNRQFAANLLIPDIVQLSCRNFRIFRLDSEYFFSIFLIGNNNVNKRHQTAHHFVGLG